MSGGIAFDARRDWMVAGWVVGALVDKACVRVGDDSEVAHWLQVGLANNLIALYRLEPQVATEMAGVIKATAEAEVDAIAQGETAGTHDDAAYAQSLVQLLAMMRECGY